MEGTKAANQILLRKVVFSVKYYVESYLSSSQTIKEVSDVEEIKQKFQAHEQKNSDIRNILYGSSLIGLGLINPILGTISYLALRFLEQQPQVQETFTQRISRGWTNLEPLTKRRIIVLGSIGASVGVVLLGSLFIRSSPLKGGTDQIFPKPTRIIGPGFSIEVDKSFCENVYRYYIQNGFKKDFTIPTSVDVELLIQSIIYLNRKFVNNEQVGFILDQIVYSLISLCVTSEV